MDRLTERELHDLVVVFPECKECRGNCGNCKYLDKALYKLKEYEDLEEQGLLLKLPCKAGETVWCLENDDYAGYVFIAIVGEYYFVAPHYEHCDDISEQLEEMGNDTENGFEPNVSVFHKSKVFLTKEEAEAKLKELENERD